MTTTSPAITSTVIPLQRNLDVLTLPHREHPPRSTGRYAACAPAPSQHAYWDAETEALFAGADAQRPPAQHGRRCGCCRPAAAVPDDVAS